MEPVKRSERERKATAENASFTTRETEIVCLMGMQAPSILSHKSTRALVAKLAQYTSESSFVSLTGRQWKQM